MARKKVATSTPPPAKVVEYPKVFDHFGEPGWAIRNLGNEPRVMNGVVDVERYTIRIEKVDEPEDVVIARLKRVWRTSERNTHTWDPVRSFVIKKFGWSYGRAMAEFPAEDQGADYIPRSR